MTRVLLLRHGHVAGIVPKRFRGRLDIPLSEEGRAQALSAANYIARYYEPEVVYTSPLQRCRDSAIALTMKLSLPAPVVASGITDIDYGAWQGRLAAEVEAAEPQRYALWRDSPQSINFPGGESLEIVAARSTNELATLASRHEDRCIAVYSHDSVIRVLLLRALGAAFDHYHRIEVDPCSLSELHYRQDGSLDMVRVNERTE